MDSQDFPSISSSNSAHKLPHKLSHGQKSLGNGHPFATHCPTKIQVKGSQSHCHPRRHHYHHQPAEFTWKAMLVLDALCKGQRFAMICIWCKIHKCPPNPQIAKLSNALPVFPRVCLSASVSDKRQEHIVQQKCKLKEVRVIAILVIITIITNHTISHHLYLHLNFVAQKPGPPKTAPSGFQFLAVAVQQWQLSKHFEPPRNTDRW